MQVIDSIEALRAVRAELQGSVGVVPTMGALHAGHLSLVQAARAENDHVIVTIFINPLQFAPGEDFERYPRDLAGDLRLLEESGADVIFTPTPALMYPQGFQTAVNVEGVVTQGLESAIRAGHFQGVTTVVAKLFNLTQPTRAYFGQKDAQQVVVLRRMVHDLNFPLSIIVCPIMREADGLALSSRNVYLDAAQRQQALVLSQGLKAAADLYAAGERDPEALRQAVQTQVDSAPLGVVDYIAINHPGTLESVTGPTDAPLLISLAVRFGATRLLDNALLPAHLNQQDGLTEVLGAVR